MKFSRKLLLMFSVLVAVGLYGCSASGHSSSSSLSSSQSSSNVSESKPTVSVQSQDDLAQLPFDVSKYPENYAIINNNVPVFENGFKQTVTAAQKAKPTRAQTYFAGLDDLGRTQSVSAIVTYGMMHSHSSAVRKRPSFPKTTKVSGEYADGVYNKNLQMWFGKHSNNRIVELIGYRGYLYNKSHLLA